ncbi:MAG: aldo/keto reductase [Armatimonadetes bacterium]|nr:aldo/keto reductase [Armatimonadota bacterium]
MNYRRMGRTGLKVSEISLGTWINFGGKIDEDAAFAVLDAALDQGINLFDTADVYERGKAEEVLGRWLKGRDRSKLVIATKGRSKMADDPNGQGAHRKRIKDACDASLKRLGTDYIDLYQIHWPDPETPLEETMGILNDLVRQGKVLYIGCSNFSAEMIAEASGIADRRNWERFTCLQPPYNMFRRDIEGSQLPRCAKEGMGIIAYSPLAQGLLTDKYLGGEVPEGSRAESNENLAKQLEKRLPIIRKLGDMAQSKGIKLSQLALAWILSHPEMTSCIVGATKPEQVAENAAASEVTLSPEEREQIEAILSEEEK